MKCISINNQVKRVTDSEAARLVASANAKYVPKSMWKATADKISSAPVASVKKVKETTTEVKTADDSIENVIKNAKKDAFNKKTKGKS